MRIDLLIHLWRVAFLMIFIFSFSCTDLGIEDDPCDETVMPEIQVSLKAAVTVLTKDGQPIPNQEMNFAIFKIPCGGTAKGVFAFDGPTDENGTRTTTVANYNLRNSEDEIWVDAQALQLGNGSADADSETVVFKYDDFTIGTTKNVQLYIYRNF